AGAGSHRRGRAVGDGRVAMSTLNRSIPMQRLSYRSLALAVAVRAALPVLVVLVTAAPASLAAQATGRVTGMVTDQNRVAVPGAQVALTGTKLGALSGLDGRYVIGGVPSGTYEVRVQRI